MNDAKATRRVVARKRCTKNMKLKNQRRRRLLKRHVTQKKNEFALLQTLRLFHLVQFVKCRQFLLEINS